MSSKEGDMPDPEPRKFRCPKAGCDKEFDEDNKLQGHIGGAHSRRRQVRHPIKHGTTSGYRSHQRQGLLPACKKCRKAWSRYIGEVKQGKHRRSPDA
jgi:hypothetical protein